ncbi:MAG TPA: hypothetical protein VMW27_04730 [Thermoanaerobaculia bacterium]|nr:hypothetical protein [Thermoanaerobaculia bacterium]
MEDQHLDQLLRELPRERASEGFTARALRRLDEPARRAPARVRWAIATAAAALLISLLSVGAWLEWREQRQTAELLQDAMEARQLLDELRAEHGRLSRDLRRLDNSGAPEVLYLGGDETMDVVVDLGQVQRVEGGTIPAAYHDQTF